MVKDIKTTVSEMLAESRRLESEDTACQQCNYIYLINFSAYELHAIY